jgi:hypothetical protein
MSMKNSSDVIGKTLFYTYIVLFINIETPKTNYTRRMQPFGKRRAGVI